MTTIQANDTRHAGKVDADDLFMRLSVPELNVYERRTRADIESKKQELRTMVGERYRDLIGAADSIVRMKETAFAVQDNIAKMRSSCDIHALKRNVAAKTKKKAQSSSMDEMKKLLYTSAAQIKLLADVPEQIWRNIESNNYLTAGRLFLISKAIYQNLKTNAEDGGDNSVDVMETFPVVGRQWDAVSHFKAQILQKSTTHLKSQKETDLSVIETLCAIMLLDNVTAKDMFRLLLTQRQTALRETLQPKGVESIGAQITQAIEILKATLYHINAVFLAPEGGQISALDRYLKSLQQTFSSPLSMTMEPLSHEQDMSTLHVKAKRNSYHPSLAPSTSTAGSTSNVPPSPHTLSTLSVPVLTKLYPNTPNIHLLARYLPESIQNLTPSLQLEGDRAAFRKQDILQGVQLWMEDVKSMLSTGFENLLQQVKTNLTLTSIRESVWDALRADEYSLIVKSKPSQWKK
ncbi:Golgi transport complex subunit 1, partial [Lunasporangiospora selenospora]